MKGDTAESQPVLAEPEYDAIEQAVMETERGRWFLREFARRHRYAETERLLDAIASLEQSIARRPAADPPESSVEESGVKRAIREMSAEIAKTKKEIAAIRPQESDNGDIADATAELDAIVASTEGATSDILEAAEQVQELAWTLREQGIAEEFCDALDVRATEIYTACSFQDITGQRTSKVVKVLQFLEARINTMAELWGGPGDAGPSQQQATAHADDYERALLNGPALDGEGVDQDEVDRMMAEAAADGVPSEQQDASATLDDIEFDVIEPEPDDTAEKAAPVETAPAEVNGDDALSVDATMEADFAAVETDAADVSAEDIESLSQKDLDALFA